MAGSRRGTLIFLAYVAAALALVVPALLGVAWPDGLYSMAIEAFAIALVVGVITAYVVRGDPATSRPLALGVLAAAAVFLVGWLALFARMATSL